MFAPTKIRPDGPVFNLLEHNLLELLVVASHEFALPINNATEACHF
jgi:hypothetical protein